MDEAALAAALASDLDAHFERLVLAFQARLFGFALRLCGSRPDAEEIAQDALVRAYRALAGYAPERVAALQLRPWLFRIALNVQRNRVRGRRLTLVPLAGPAEDDGPADPADPAGDEPAEVAAQLETRRELVAQLLALPPRYREAVVLRHVEGLGYAEAAALLGQPVGTVKANVHRGVRLLRERLAPVRAELGA